MPRLPFVPDKEKNYQGYMVFVLALTWGIVVSLTVSLGFYFFPALWSRWLTYLLISLFICFLNLFLNHVGYTKLASWLLSFFLWAFITVPCYSAGGMSAPGILSQTSVILTAGFLLGWRGGVAVGLLTVGADLWMANLELLGQLPVPTVHHTPFTRWVGAFIPFGTIIALQYYATNHLNGALVSMQREIKTREEAEQALQKSEIWHRSLVENINDAITVVDEQRRIIYRSQSVGRITGYTLEEAKQKNFLQLIHPADRDRAAEFIDNVFKTPGMASLGQFRLEHKDGHYIWIEMTLTNLLHLEGVKGIVNNYRDITERVKAQEIINKRESELTAFFENAEGAASLIDTEKCYVLFNRRFVFDHKLLTGVEPLQGDKIYEHFSPEIQAERHKLLDEVLQGQKKIVEVEYVREGRRIYYRTAYYPVITDGKVTGITTYSIDLTENKEAQLALARSEEKHRAMVENITDAIFLMDAEGKIFYRSPSAGRISGYSDDEMVGKSVFDFVHPDDMDKCMGTFKKSAATPGYPVRYEFRISHKDARFIWVEGSTINLVGNDSVKAYIVNYRDITERKRAEEEIWLLNNSLEQKVQDRTIRLVEANRALESFSYTVAHDLRAPVRAMLGFTKIIEEDYMPEFNDELKELFGYINISGKRMSSIIEDLLTLAKYEKVQLKTTFVNMADLFNQVWNTIQLNNPHQAELQMEPLPPALADSSLIEQVVTNLLSNAIKYSSKKEKPVVQISFQQEGDIITYVVKDNGAGFDMKNYNRLFGAFQRLHGSSEFEGTGVGLLLVKRIIEKHGGTIRAEGIVGEGATFYFTLHTASIAAPAIN